jgi:hypothetical protein
MEGKTARPIAVIGVMCAVALNWCAASSLAATTLASDEMTVIRGGCNRQLCQGTDRCTSTCEEYTQDEYKMLAPIGYDICVLKYWWQSGGGCVNDTQKLCGEWREYGNETCTDQGSSLGKTEYARGCNP